MELPFFKEVQKILDEENYDEEVFHKNRTKNILQLGGIYSTNTNDIIKIRSKVRPIQIDQTIMKILAPLDVGHYLQSDYSGIIGFISKYSDKPDCGSTEIIKQYGLNYSGSPFFNKKIFELADFDNSEDLVYIVDRLYIIITKAARSSLNDDYFKVPIGTDKGMTDDEEAIRSYVENFKPFTGHGFTCGDQYTLPEFFIHFDDYLKTPQPFADEDKIIEVTHNKEIKEIAVFHGMNNKWIRL